MDEFNQQQSSEQPTVNSAGDQSESNFSSEQTNVSNVHTLQPVRSATETQVSRPFKDLKSNPKYVDHAITAHEMDAELEALLSQQTAKIKVVGCGGAGNNTINRMTEVGIEGAETIAINTDAQDLLYTSATKKILIGRETTHGLGAGSVPKVGEDSAREQEADIKKAIHGADMVFITAGLGSGTGTGSAPIVAEVAKKMGA